MKACVHFDQKLSLSVLITFSYVRCILCLPEIPALASEYKGVKVSSKDTVRYERCSSERLDVGDYEILYW